MSFHILWCGKLQRIKICIPICIFPGRNKISYQLDSKNSTPLFYCSWDFSLIWCCSNRLNGQHILIKKVNSLMSKMRVQVTNVQVHCVPEWKWQNSFYKMICKNYVNTISSLSINAQYFSLKIPLFSIDLWCE